MGFFKRLAKAASGPDWEAWAAQHGWTFEAQAPDLGGVFHPVPAGDRQGEEYHHVVRGSMHGVGFIVFTRTSWGAPKGATQGNYQHDPHLAIELPRAVAPALLAMSPADAFASLGGSLVGPWNFRWHGDRWLVGAGHVTAPVQVEQSLEQVGVQIGGAPATVWA